MGLRGFIGAISGYVGGKTDAVIMRTADVILAFPDIILAMAIVAALGPSILNSMSAIVIIWIPIYARLVRGQVQAEMNKEYVGAAIALGGNESRILCRHILPGCFGITMVKVTLDIGRAIRYLAFLSFIGIGARQPAPEWGLMVASGRAYMVDAWWFPTFPGIFIFMASLAFSLFGDTLSDAINPERRSTIRSMRWK